MWLSLNIIKKMVDISDISPEDLANRLTMSTAEIDSIDYINQHFKTIITAKAADVKKHPDADKLTLVDIDTGSEKLPIVCGAPNHKSGDIVALATVGTKFTEEFTIKETKIRGEKSMGMLCSAKELGLSEDHAGIIIFPEDTKIGVPLSEIYKDWVDVRLEIDNKSITHRPDLWSHLGFAREIGAILGRPVKNPVNFDLEKELGSEKSLNVKVENPGQGLRYSGLVMKNISVGESPEWLKAAVTSIGMRPINNLVDITNYVMAEIGEPMHAFDRQKLRGDTIFVRNAKNGEKLKTLDDQEHELCEEDIVIADKDGAIALAGVMGGDNSEIDESTSEIILEAANFNAVNIRKTATRYNLRTEAAIRFEKSQSSELTTLALLRCYELIKECIPEVEAVTPIIDDYPEKSQSISLTINTETIRQRLGEEISDNRIVEIIDSLDFIVSNSNGSLTVEVPHYRATKDVSIGADIIEEVGRIYGYDNIVSTAPLVPCEPPMKNSERLFERDAKTILSRNCNLTEVSGYSFVGEESLNKLKINEDKELRLKHALSQEQDRLRRNLIPNIISNIVTNQRYHNSFGIYEWGRVYLKDDRKSEDLVAEERRITGAVFNKKAETPVFYDAKNVVIQLMKDLHVKSYRLLPTDKNLPPYAHPGRSMKLEIAGKEAGLICELHPGVYKDFEINGDASIFEINASILFKTKKEEKSFEELQKFPEVPFELSIVTDKSTYAGDIAILLSKADKKLIKNVEVLSVYEGAPLEDGKKSISLKTVFASKSKTLEPQEIEELQNKIIKSVNKAGYELR